MALAAKLDVVEQDLRANLADNTQLSSNMERKISNTVRDDLPREQMPVSILQQDSEIDGVISSNDDKSELDSEKRHFTLNDADQKPHPETVAKGIIALSEQEAAISAPDMNSNATIPSEGPEPVVDLKTKSEPIIDIKKSESAEQIEENRSEPALGKIPSSTEPFPTSPVNVQFRKSIRDSGARNDSSPVIRKNGVEKVNSISSNDGRQQGSTSGLSTSSKYKLYRKQSEREVLVGTPVKEGHSNYMMMYDMLTGIRISVSRCSAKQHREIVPADYVAAHKLAFDV